MGDRPVIHPTRDEAFAAISEALKDSSAYGSASAVVAHGDSLPLLERMPDDSVSLILTDPPYSMGKADILNDSAFAEDDDFIEWMGSYARQWRRVLRSNGTLYVFCSPRMSARLEVMISGFLRPMAHVVWTKPNEPGFDGWRGKARKESLRSFWPHSERILVFEHGRVGVAEARRRSPFGEYLREVRLGCGMSMHDLAAAAGAGGRVNHGGAVSNWETGRSVPSETQYEAMRTALMTTGGVADMPRYRDVIRPMFLSGDVEYTDVWDFSSVRPFRGKHPAEKPIAMLNHIIGASSYPGDVVLDCFAGSGSTAEAAIGLGRRSVSMEMDDGWIPGIVDRVIRAEAGVAARPDADDAEGRPVRR